MFLLKPPWLVLLWDSSKKKDEFVVLSDILGDEDHLGDMDFKVAGTAEGITALQMDIKIHGVTQGIMETALEQARVGATSYFGENEPSCLDRTENHARHRS